MKEMENAEGQELAHNDSKRDLIKNRINPRKVPSKDAEDEDYGTSIKEWIPAPHEKIQHDEPDESLANTDAEDLTDWLQEGQKTHLPLRRKIMSAQNNIPPPPRRPDEEDYNGESLKEWIPTPHEKIKQDEEDPTLTNASTEELSDWLSEGKKKHEPLKRNKTRSQVIDPNAAEKEDYSGEPLEEWIPKPHPKIKEDNDNAEGYDNEIISDWNPEKE